jgi:hypothetical protein
VEIVPDNPNAGDSIEVKWTIKNIGDAATAQGVTIGAGLYFLAMPDPNWMYSDNYSQSLAPGQSAVVTSTAFATFVNGVLTHNVAGGKAPIPGGRFALWSIVDDAHRISESNENNNYGIYQSPGWSEGRPTIWLESKTKHTDTDGKKLSGSTFQSGLFHEGMDARFLFDGDMGSNMLAETGEMVIVGLAFGSAYSIGKISYYPWFFHGNQCVGGVFQGSTEGSNGPWEDICKITSKPPDDPADWTDVYLDSATKAYKAVRYISPSLPEQRGTMSELAFYADVTRDTSHSVPTSTPSIPKAKLQQPKTKVPTGSTKLHLERTGTFVDFQGRLQKKNLQSPHGLQNQSGHRIGP